MLCFCTVVDILKVVEGLYPVILERNTVPFSQSTFRLDCLYVSGQSHDKSNRQPDFYGLNPRFPSVQVKLFLFLNQLAGSTVSCAPMYGKLIVVCSANWYWTADETWYVYTVAIQKFEMSLIVVCKFFLVLCQPAPIMPA